MFLHISSVLTYLPFVFLRWWIPCSYSSFPFLVVVIIIALLIYHSLYVKMMLIFGWLKWKESVSWIQKKKKKRKKVLVAQLCPTLCKPMDCGLSGSVHGILQVRILEWVAIPFSRGSSWPRDWTWVSCIAGRFLTIWATRETLADYDISIVLNFFTCLLILFLHGFLRRNFLNFK